MAMEHLPGVHSKEKTKGSIPDFEVEEYDDGTDLMVNCTRCKEFMLIDRRSVEKYAGTTRPCFHCFKVSYVPEEGIK